MSMSRTKSTYYFTAGAAAAYLLITSRQLSYSHALLTAPLAQQCHHRAMRQHFLLPSPSLRLSTRIKRKNALLKNTNDEIDTSSPLTSSSSSLHISSVDNMDNSASSLSSSTSLHVAMTPHDDKSNIGVETSSNLFDKLSGSFSAAAFLSLLLIGMKFAIRGGNWRYYLAGGICASSSHAITTPIDVVKTRQQVDPTLSTTPLLKATHKIIKAEGLPILLSGLGPTTFGYLLEGAVKFGVYEVLKPIVQTLLFSATTTVPSFLIPPSSYHRILTFVICGAASGIAASAMLCPMEALRIRLVAEPELMKEGWVSVGANMMRREGVMGLWKGMTAMMAKQVPYTITKQVLFDVLTLAGYSFVRTQGLVLSRGVKLAVPLASAAVAAFLSCISSQPGDLLLSVVNAHEDKRKTRVFAKEIMQKSGWRGFFVGVRARLLHVGIIVTFQLMIYDFVKRLCGIAATGSC